MEERVQNNFKGKRGRQTIGMGVMNGTLGGGVTFPLNFMNILLNFFTMDLSF